MRATFRGSRLYNFSRCTGILHHAAYTLGAVRFPAYVVSSQNLPTGNSANLRTPPVKSEQAPLPLLYFEGHGANPFVDADEDNRSTFALDGDTNALTACPARGQSGDGRPCQFNTRLY